MDRDLAVILVGLFGSSSIIGFLFRSYVKRLDAELRHVVEDRDYYRDALFHTIGLADRQAGYTEKLVDVVAKKEMPHEAP